MNRAFAPLVGILFASAALAHTGVKDTTVLAWMDGMKTISEHTKSLTQMSRGQIAYDAMKADAIIADMTAQAARIPVLFEVQASDPNSEARPEIWSDRDAFVAYAQELEDVLASADTSSPAMIGLSLRDIGKPCRACHEDFRLSN